MVVAEIIHFVSFDFFMERVYFRCEYSWENISAGINGGVILRNCIYAHEAKYY